MERLFRWCTLPKCQSSTDCTERIPELQARICVASPVTNSPRRSEPTAMVYGKIRGWLGGLVPSKTGLKEEKEE